MSKNVKIDDLGNAISSMLREYGDEVLTAVDEVLPLVSKDTVHELKATSPRKTGSYAASWGVTNEDGRLSKKAIIHNKKHYRLVHLLENGHINKAGKRVKGGGRVMVTTGFVHGIPHVKPAEERAVDEFYQKLREAIEKV